MVQCRIRPPMKPRRRPPGLRAVTVSTAAGSSHPILDRSSHPEGVMELITVHGVMILRARMERAGSGPGMTGGGAPPWSWASR
jgi:hypothetical protein